MKGAEYTLFVLFLLFLLRFLFVQHPDCRGFAIAGCLHTVSSALFQSEKPSLLQYSPCSGSGMLILIAKGRSIFFACL